MAAFYQIKVYVDSEMREANAIGNNAAWMCPCGYELPLIASLFMAKEVSCPSFKCNRRYKLIAGSRGNDNPIDSIRQIPSR